MENPCLRPACLSDVYLIDDDGDDVRACVPVRKDGYSLDPLWRDLESLRALYNAEWAKRGFEESP